MFSYILDYLDRLYCSINKREAFCGKKVIGRLILSAIYHLNNSLCWYYHNVRKDKISSPDNSDYVVSLTTYPARVGIVWKVIEMAANQKGIKENYAICLYLIESEFEGIELPDKIKELQERGLTVKFNKENLKCHNKYYYAFKDYPQKKIVTIDDDLQYNHHSITALVETNKKYPTCIAYNRGNRIIPYAHYKSWPFVENETIPRCDILPTGVGGVLYPPYCCDSLVTNMDVIKQTCLKADDLWLNFNSRLNKTKVVQTGLKSTYMVLPDTIQDFALWATNNDEMLAGNDVQIAQITEWTHQNINCDYFVNL